MAIHDDDDDDGTMAMIEECSHGVNDETSIGLSAIRRWHRDDHGPGSGGGRLGPAAATSTSPQRILLSLPKEPLRAAHLANLAEAGIGGGAAVRGLALAASEAHLLLDALDPGAALVAHLDILGLGARHAQRAVLLG